MVGHEWARSGVALLAVMLAGCGGSNQGAEEAGERFPRELVEWVAHPSNPLFTGTGGSTWDREIRERGYILREGDLWHLWYTGYNLDRSETMALGYATSQDGLNWERHPENPIYSERWTEDMMVVKVGDTYYMAAEGRGDIAHLLTSPDGVHWTDRGDLEIRYRDGRPLSAGAYGTPTFWVEEDQWFLFYEREDEAIWLARSEDLETWTNVQDEPVLESGPEEYDRFGVALNQVIRYQGRYYAVYHATDREDWSLWSTNLATSEDLVHWTKYEGNPMIENNRSSGIFVPDGGRLLLYTMHPEVCRFEPANR